MRCTVKSLILVCICLIIFHFHWQTKQTLECLDFNCQTRQTCGTGSQTTEHLLQSCPTDEPLRKGIWPDHTPVARKLYGSLSYLRCTATFIGETGVSIWRTRRRRRDKKDSRMSWLLLTNKIDTWIIQSFRMSWLIGKQDRHPYVLISTEKHHGQLIV